MRTRLLFSMCCIFIVQAVQSQTTSIINLQWKDPVLDQNRSFVFFEGAAYNEKGLPVYGEIFENQKIESATLSDVITTPLPPDWVGLVGDLNQLPKEFDINITNKIANSGNYA